MIVNKIKLAIVDDHQIVIDGLHSLLKGHNRYEIVLESTHPETILAQLKKQPVDILLTDVMMPGLPGNELARLVKQKFPAVKILALSMIMISILL